MSTRKPGYQRERKLAAAANQGDPSALAGHEQQTLTLRLMTKLWRRFEATAERELGAESAALAMLRTHIQHREGKSRLP